MSRYHANELLNNRKNDIQHWKYVKKIPVGKSYRYFYSWAEYKAYLADLKKAGSAAKSEIKKSAKKSYTEVKKRGKKVLKKTSYNTALSEVKAKNKSRDTSFRDKINRLANRASKKWAEKKETVEKKINEGKKWIDKTIHKKKYEREEAERKVIEAYNKKAEKVAKKYKYLKRVKINGRYYYFYTQDEIENFNKVKEYQANEPNFMKKVKESDVPYTSQENSILVNPKFDMYDLDDRWEYNCAQCTAIYELRMRGYDVESNGSSGLDEKSIIYNTVDRFDAFYKDAKVQTLKPTKTDEETYKAIKKEIEKNPPGSRGDLSVQWKDGGGHSVAWERDLNGKIHIIDTQFSGHGGQTEYDLRALCRNVDNSKSAHQTGKEWGEPPNYVVRTDNLELKPEIQNIYKETKDKKRKKPNTRSTFTVDWDKVADNYIQPDNIMPTRSMTQKEIETQYYHLVNN